MTYGLTRVGFCARCNQPEYLFVHSSQETLEFCLRCMQHFLYPIEEPMPLAEDFSFVTSHETCAGCLRPEYVEGDVIRWKLVEARLADETIVKVHTACRSHDDCEDCDYRYAHSNNRSYGDHMRFYISSSTYDPTMFSDMVNIERGWRCNSCAVDYYDSHGGAGSFIYCEPCENNVHFDNSGRHRGTRYCNSCIRDNVYDCDDCGSEVWSGDDHDCDEDNRSTIIHSYGYKPNPIFFGKGTYHMGFELEVEARNSSRFDTAKMAQEILGEHAYMKSDASLEDGFEIVTHPHTLEYYQEQFEWSVLTKLRRQGIRSWNTTTCGLHVHVSREAFGGTVNYNSSPQDIMHMQAHQLRFMKLIYDNERQVSRIAGRANNNYASFSDKGKLVPKVKLGHSMHGHCAAVNTENYATIEIRVFKGSLRKERVLSALEFVTAGVEYTRDLKISGKNNALSWLRFTAYVSQEAEKYPNLALIMSESFSRDNDPSDDDN